MPDANPEDISLQDAADPELLAEQMLQAEKMAKEMADARSRLLETEASVIIANHAFGLYELAAIHVTTDEPDLDEARLAIDGLDALVTGLTGRLGDSEESLKDALSDIKMVYVRRVTEVRARTAAEG